MAANDDIQNESILHAVFMARYRTHVLRQMIKYLDEEVWPEVMRRLEEDLQATPILPKGTRTFRLQEEVAGLISAGTAELNRRMAEEMAGFGEAEAEWQLLVLRKQLPVKINLSTPSPQLVRAITQQRPFEGALMKQWFRGLAVDTQKKLEQQITMGMVAGESVPQMVTRIRGTKAMGFKNGVIATNRRQAESIVRTAVAHVSAQARQIGLEENQEVLKGVQWSSVLDFRTTIICIDLDGKVFPLDEGPRPPAHWGCRSDIIPVVKSWKELGFDFKELPESTRASLNGQVAAKTTYGSWLKSQPRDVQDEVLGPQRAALFRNGSVSIGEFTDDRRRPLSLRQLRQKAGLDR